MKRYWHRLIFPCPKCSTEVRFIELLAASDGEMIISGHCNECAVDYNFKTDVDRILTYCRIADKVNNDADASKPNQPLRPPLALPAPAFDDSKFLHDAGIAE